MSRHKDTSLLRNQYPGKFEVYLLGTLEDKPIYAGQGKIDVRIKHHLKPSGSKRFGLKSSEIKIIHRVIVESKQEALELEEKFIEKFQPEFNISKRDGFDGCHHSEDSKKKISEARKGMKFSDEHKSKLRDAAIKQQKRNRGEIC